ncbi:hypothetical protein WOLCODRAFT_152309 [Wolfiporia cocos MD-104 SS10]|uniref:Autophagy-related protein 17 n=1 Tax=Wolfiporia cocos (strain MD-104) TaxID=742152 RepID=A0A2H3JJ99_WOLCO|nr:hypothetical protein WOLCODRAFT_152309 [Wolfiporia cocos MD-104 SS10]
MAARVAKSIEQTRSRLDQQAKEWDSLRNQRADALDAILESLGAQAVPPEFNTSSAPDIDPSPFAQHDSDDEQAGAELFEEQQPSQSPTNTIRNMSGTARPHANGAHKSRSSWKTLRDFVDERAIEDMLDTIESDRNALDDILARTSDYPESLTQTISAIESGLPVDAPLPSIDEVFSSQEMMKDAMARHLESLAAHYEQMSSALCDQEAGEEFRDDELTQMNRDTDELPAIITELEDSIASIAASYEQLLAARQATQQLLDSQRQTLDDLDELGDIMSEMLERQQDVELESTEHLTLLHQHLAAVEDLHHRFASYQYSYNKLLLELARRRQYSDGVQQIVKGMVAQLDALTQEERQLREDFNNTHGQYLPEDVCLFAQRMPTRWTVIPVDGEQVEVLPEIDSDLLVEARTHLRNGEPAIAASQSL